MDNQKNLLLAVVFSLFVLIGYDFFFNPKTQMKTQEEPSDNPVIVPSPFIVIGIRLSPHHIYTIVQAHPDGTVTAIPAFIDIGPALIAFFVEVI